MNERVLELLKNFDINAYQSDLIGWFLTEKRDLPWRRTQDPYKIWVSEIMLQQTRVDTVIPYFNKFMKKFPTIEALADADEQELLKVWEGLGYYSRVRNLQSAVREVQTEYGGKVPNKKEEFSQLKGVGPYTTGAVLSIAYGVPEPAVDGNVMRVLSRIFEIKDDIAKPKTRKLFESLTAEIISKEDPSSFNQGLMELGALICKPGKPSCLLCPVREHCRAFHNGKESELPVKSKKTKVKSVQLMAAVIETDNKEILLRKRPNEGLLANMWEFPNEEIQISPVKNILSDYEEQVREKHEIKVKLEEPLCVIEHEFSHLKWHIQVFKGKLSGEMKESESFKAIPIEKIEEYPLPVSHQKIWNQYKKDSLLS